MRAAAIACICVSFATGVAAQVDTGAEDLSGPDEEAIGEVPTGTQEIPRNKTTAERLSSPVPTTEGVPWSFPLFWNQTVTVRSFNQDSQLTYSPNYTWWFTAAPRWLFSPQHSIGATQTVSIEWTDSADVEFNRLGFASREALWEDLRIDYLYSVPVRPAGFMFFVAADLRFPTSKFSRSRDRYISPGIRFTAVRPFSVLQGMQLGITTAFWGWFAGSNVVLAPDAIQPCRIAPGPGGIATTDTCGGATASIQHTTRLTGFWTFVPVDRLALALSYTALWARANDLALGCIQTATGEFCVDEQTDNPRWRTFSNFRVSIGYDIKRWFTLALSYDVWAQYPDSDGTLENPFFNENSRVIITLTFRADGLYASVRDRRIEGRASRTGVEEF
ncbi:MAG: hypothetical protein AAF500_12365 [Myxococcota bacterium]